MKLKEWLKQWLENYVKPSSKDRTYSRYNELVRLHIDPILGDYELCELSGNVIQSFIGFLLKNGNLRTQGGLSSNTVSLIVSVLNSSLFIAGNAGILGYYVTDSIKKPTKIEREIDCFTPEEQGLIESEILSGKKSKMFGVVLCFYTGLRIGELLALTWSDIDTEEGLIVVSKSCHDGKDASGRYKKIIETPKTKNSKRLVPLPNTILKRIKLLQKQSDSDFVVSEKGKGVSVRSYQRSFELLLRKLGIVHRGFHSIRHTFATRALECGMDVKTLSDILGHKSPTITLNRYVHSSLKRKKDMMNRVGKLLKKFTEEHIR